MGSTSVDIFNSPEFACLSNFAEGFGFWTVSGSPPKRQWWPSAEHFFQAGKFADEELQDQIRRAEEPGVAKALGRKLGPMRPDWDSVKRARIGRAMLEKLWAHRAPREVLLAIPEDVRIVNGNPADPFFGTGGDGAGANVIGLELESLRSLLLAFPARRCRQVEVAGVGAPLEPFTASVELTGVDPSWVGLLIAESLCIPREAISGVELVTDCGFEKTSLAELADAKSLDAFIGQHEDDCGLQVDLVDPAMVTLWDATLDAHLGRTDLRHLCPTFEALVQRLQALVPITRHAAFYGGVSFSVDGEDGQVLDATSFPRAVAAAGRMADVVISIAVAVPQELQPPLLKPPCAQYLGPCSVDLASQTALDKDALIDRIRGVVWGAALGDAVGLATEFMKKDEAARHYPDPARLSPSSRVQDNHRSRWQSGDWTDDTDQLVLLLDAVVAGRGVLDQRSFAESLKRWRDEGFPELGDSAGKGIGDTVNTVLDHPAFDVAPDAAADAVWRQSGCTMAANGAIMRCAASALAYFWDDEVVTYNALAGAAATHADPRCAASCALVAAVVARALLGIDLSSAERRREEVAVAAMSSAKHLDGQDTDELWRFADVDTQGLQDLRLEQKIGYTYKALGAACWAFVHAESFKEAISAITMEAGDADSNAAVAGALLGARLGYSKLPGDWLQELPPPQVSWLEGKVAACLRLLGLA